VSIMRFGVKSDNLIVPFDIRILLPVTLGYQVGSQQPSNELELSST